MNPGDPHEECAYCQCQISMKYNIQLSTLTVLIFVIFVQSIDIRTSSFIEVYSGPGGTVKSPYQTASSSVTYSKYESTVTFVLLGTSLEEYYYKPVAEAFGPPTIKVLEGVGVIDPILFGSAASGYYFDSTNVYWLEIPELGIYFNCQTDGKATVEISIYSSLIDESTHTTLNETITFYMQKECVYSGYREGFSIGYEDDRNDDVVKHGVVQSNWSLESYEFIGQRSIVIPESQHVSVFRISIPNSGYGNQYYEAPKVKVEDRGIVELQVRGSADKGGIANQLPETLVLFYTCKKRGITDINIVINLEFYGHIEIGFMKECTLDDKELVNNNKPSGVINIGLSKSDYSNVIQNSIASSAWQADNPTTTVGPEDLLSVFYISTLSGREQPFMSPLVSVYPSNAFHVTVSGSARSGGVATGNPQRFVINYICDKVSEGHVIVTIKLPGFDTIEFGYKKKCVKLIRHTGHIYTANQILIALLAFVGSVILIGVFIMKKRKSDIERKSKTKVSNQLA